ncbi:hypothetical protein GJ700_20310 [Duganella sp. FT92W]|uniref:Uncharacterized protein n=1 Tax=Pseudoduganella rivuli TaxID=2666085 RepID=A0A7X2LU58_9BURK|nr:hypothetical protein [Pseudoduganella rivuli]MRV74056.1 hypothetical protein [Pseudoduganella rivuli]
MAIIASTGDTVKVYSFSVYDINQDEFVQSTRYATFNAIEKLSAMRSSHSHDIPARDVDSDGFTVKGYDPYK